MHFCKSSSHVAPFLQFAPLFAQKSHCSYGHGRSVIGFSPQYVSSLAMVVLGADRLLLGRIYAGMKHNTH